MTLRPRPAVPRTFRVQWHLSCRTCGRLTIRRQGEGVWDPDPSSVDETYLSMTGGRLRHDYLKALSDGASARSGGAQPQTRVNGFQPGIDGGALRGSLCRGQQA